MDKTHHVIVGNRGSYYHEGYWAGKKKKFVQNVKEAKIFKSKSPTKSQLDEFDYVKQNFPWAYPMFVQIGKL